jgi:YVTN family beta-propeller protein
MNRRFVCHGAAAAILLVAAALIARSGDTAKTTDARLRRPVAIVPTEDGRRLFVANSRAGSVSVVDVADRRILAEVAVGRALADLADAGQGRLLAVEESSGELIVLSRRGDALDVRSRVKVGDSPVRVRLTSRGRAVVACLWPRQLDVIELAAAAPPRLRKSIALPFSPRELLPLPGSDRVVVADAFGGRLAVIDTDRGVVESVRSVPGHNLRGLALSPDGQQLWLSQQLLAEDTPTRADDVRWGNVITNGVRSLAIKDVVKPDADLLRLSRLYALGQFLKGAADPAGVAVARDRVLVTLGGTGELALGPSSHGDWERLAVGRRPTAISVAADRAFVADTFGDSVIVVDLAERKKVAAISLGPTPELTAAERGEMLFFDARLSMEGWMSCQSCHTDGHTNGLRSDTLGDGSYGAPKRVPTLRGVGDTAPWAWNGSLARLEDQVVQSIRTTMRGSRPTEKQVADLVAFLRSLPPPPASRGVPVEASRRGKVVFDSAGCARCHAPPTYTTPRTYEVGLEDELGKLAFNPPSLRGVGQGVAFFHDGRASSLEEVFTRHRHQIPADLARRDLDDLLAYLRTL